MIRVLLANGVLCLDCYYAGDDDWLSLDVALSNSGWLSMALAGSSEAAFKMSVGWRSVVE